MLFLLFAEIVNSEIVNSEIEALADRITTEHSELIGRAKDLGSACVFIAFSILVLVWIYAFMNM
jgi:diacylglycerol kinase (ATP)